MNSKNLKTKEETIHDMCFTMRHDYGLHKDDLPEGYPIDFCSGMTGSERKILHMQMSQLYDQHIAPLQKLVEEAENKKNMVDITKPFCKNCKTNLVYYDGWHCECEGPDVFKHWEAYLGYDL